VVLCTALQEQIFRQTLLAVSLTYVPAFPTCQLSTVSNLAGCHYVTLHHQHSLQAQFADNLSPDVTSTSTGRTNFWWSFSLLVRMRMNTVWLLSSRAMKLAFMIGFVSYGGISCNQEINRLPTLFHNLLV